DDHRLRDRRSGVRVVAGEIRVAIPGIERVGVDIRPSPEDRPLDRLRVRVDQELGRVEAAAPRRVVPPVDPVPVPLPLADAGEVASPGAGRDVGQLDASGLAILRVEQAELDALGVLGEEREVRTRAVPLGAEGERPARPGVQTRAPTPPPRPYAARAPPR